MLGVFQYSSVLLQPWVQGWKVHAFLRHPWMFLDIDSTKLAAAK
jgi:hypothetical protein